jgi:hypothetical protein
VTNENHPLLGLHHGLTKIGKFIGIITRLALIVGLVGVPVLALIMGSMLAAMWG